MTDNEILDALISGSVLEFNFTKQNGEQRRLLGKWVTRDSIEEEINAPGDRYIVWDVENNGWRSIIKSSISSTREVLFGEN